MDALLVNTPKYVLLSQTQRIGPEVLGDKSGAEGVAVYGFSGKKQYDAFRAKSAGLLMPYPLVKRYLKNQLDDAPLAILLVVLDAAGPHEPSLVASTMQTVLQAHEKGTRQVDVSYKLSWDEGNHGYRAADCSPVAVQ